MYFKDLPTSKGLVHHFLETDLRMRSEQRHPGLKILQLDIEILEIFPTSDFIFAIET